MRVALCISGQPRFFKNGHQFLKANLMDINENVDVFIHGWFDPNDAGKPYDASPWNAGRLDTISVDLPQELESLYRPKKMLLEPQRHFEPPRDYSSFMAKTPPHILFSLQYSIQQSIRLKSEYEREQGFAYDWVVRARTDWALKTPIVLKNWGSYAIHYPNDIDVAGAANDQFAFSCSANMDYYATLFDKIDYYWTHFPVRLSGESLIGIHLVQSGIELAPIPIDYAIIRGLAPAHKEIVI